MTIWLRECDRVGLLTAEDEIELARRIAAGDEEARDRMARGNLRLVVAIARAFRGRGVAFEDLVCEGNVGLLIAVDRFDPARGVRFSTYASYWIKQAIVRHVRDHGSAVRIPSYMHDLLAKWRDASARLAGESGDPPSAEIVAASLGLAASKARCVQAAAKVRRVDSLDGRRAGGDADWCESNSAAEPRSHLPPLGVEMEDAEQAEADRRRLEAAIGRLDGRMAAVLRLRFGLGGGKPRTLKEIGAEVGISRERVRQVEEAALGGLREILEEAHRVA
jgi:RNA polymerase primary sigma factor